MVNSGLAGWLWLCCGPFVLQIEQSVNCEFLLRGFILWLQRGLAMKKTAKKDFVIRARCGSDVKTLLGLAAHSLGLDESDVIRLAIKQYAASIIGTPSPVLHGPR